MILQVKHVPFWFFIQHTSTFDSALQKSTKIFPGIAPLHPRIMGQEIKSVKTDHVTKIVSYCLPVLNNNIVCRFFGLFMSFGNQFSHTGHNSCLNFMHNSYKNSYISFFHACLHIETSSPFKDLVLRNLTPIYSCICMYVQVHMCRKGTLRIRSRNCSLPVVSCRR